MTAIMKLYLRLIEEGEKTIDDVPVSIREEIQKILDDRKEVI